MRYVCLALLMVAGCTDEDVVEPARAADPRVVPRSDGGAPQSPPADPPNPCTNGQLDYGEVDVDCGGSCAAHCGIGARCDRDFTCASGVCNNGTCWPLATCRNGRRDPGEGDIDCGVVCGRECDLGALCGGDGDCSVIARCERPLLALATPPPATSAISGRCVIRHCFDKERSGDEADVDCGGGCEQKCATQRDCAVDGDCLSARCLRGRCVAPGAPAWLAPLTQQRPPPPLSGGTLRVLADGRTAVASDPDRDRVAIVDLKRQLLLGDVALDAGDEPGRAVDDAAGRIHVVLRRGGAVATVDLRLGVQVALRRPVCAAPRGIAYAADEDVLYVVCAGGEVMRLPAAAGPAELLARIDDDLRDVVIAGKELLISRFRRAEVLRFAEGAVTDRRALPGQVAFDLLDGSRFEPGVAWRMVAAGEGRVAVVHQRAAVERVSPLPGGYGNRGGGGGNNRCGGSIVHGAVTLIAPGEPIAAAPAIVDAVLPIDLAIAPSGNTYAVVAAGNGWLYESAQVFVGELSPQGRPACPENAPLVDGKPFAQPIGQAIAVAFDGGGRLIVQTREPASLQILTGQPVTIQLAADSRYDTGHTIFHSSSGANIACASCHPEGGEDGQVWRLDNVGPRRTLSLRGGVLGLAPFHWDGDLPSLHELVDDVLSQRMSGPTLRPAEQAALAGWLDRIPALPLRPPVDAKAVARGRALFDDPKLACASCHKGPQLTSHARVDVGTGGTFKVPSLRGLAYRAPYFHDGQVATVRDRFGNLGGGDQHGTTSQLDDAAIDDLTAFLQSL